MRWNFLLSAVLVFFAIRWANRILCGDPQFTTITGEAPSTIRFTRVHLNGLSSTPPLITPLNYYRLNWGWAINPSTSARFTTPPPCPIICQPYKLLWNVSLQHKWKIAYCSETSMLTYLTPPPPDFRHNCSYFLFPSLRAHQNHRQYSNPDRPCVCYWPCISCLLYYSSPLHTSDHMCISVGLS